MNSKLHWLTIATVTMISGVSFGQTRYVSTTGTDATNNCDTPGNPCGSIEHAYTQINDGDTIKLAPGTYDLSATFSISTPVVLTALDALDKPVITSSASDVINVNSDDVTISNLKFEMGLTASTGLKGIVSNADFDNIKITDNEFESVNPITAGAMVFGAYAIQLNSVVGDVQNATITGNHIWADMTTANMFGRGIALGISTADGPGAMVSGNDITAYYPIQAVRNADDLDISENTLNGIIMINYPLEDVIATIEDNDITGNTQLTPANLYSLLDIRAIEVGFVNITNNNITDFQNIGLLSMASKNVVADGNTFTPLASANNFASIMANTKLMTNGVQGNTFSDEIKIVGNTFNAGVVNQGSAIIFADHYGVNTPAFNSIIVGGQAADKNTFATGLGNYVSLDGQTGASTSFALWAPYPATTMVPFSQDVEALIVNNNYNQATVGAIENKNQDELDNNALGKVKLFAEGDNRYVATTGDDASNDCTLPGFPCASFERAITVAADNDSIIVAAGDYALTSILNPTQDGLTITAADETDLPVLTTNQTTVFDIAAEDVTINALRMEMGLTSTTGKYAVVSTASIYDGLTLTNNEILSSSPVIPYGMVWDAFAVKLTSASNTEVVDIENNTIGTVTPNGNNIFGRGITLGSGANPGPGATIDGNEVMAFYTVQAISSTSDVTVTNNDFNGILMLNAPAQDVDLVVTDNTFDAVTPMSADSLYALVEIRSIENGTALIQNNEFSNYTTIALISEASKNVEVSANEFAPATAAEDFVSLMVNTKLMTNGVQGNTYSDEIVIKGNDFVAGAAEGGTAIVFADHYGANASAFGTITIGGATAAEKNDFDTDLGNYIVLDNKSGVSTAEPFWAAYTATTMKPVTQDIEALIVNNTYNLGNSGLIEDKNIDSLDNDILGKVILAYSFVGLNELAEEVATVYPNPAISDFTVSLTNNTETAVVTVVDLLGNVVYTSTFTGKTTIDATAFNNGVYLVNLNVNGTTSSTRIVKN